MGPHVLPSIPNAWHYSQVMHYFAWHYLCDMQRIRGHCSHAICSGWAFDMPCQVLCSDTLYSVPNVCQLLHARYTIGVGKIK